MYELLSGQHESKTVLLLFVSALAASHVSPCVSRAQPFAHRVIFDDFNYASNAVDQGGSVFGPNEWTNRMGDVVTNGRFWYRSNWSDYGSDTLVKVEVRRSAPQGALHLEALPGHKTIWEKNRMPPMVVSGFTSPTGVWAVRLKLADLSKEVSMMQSFWTMSPYTMCKTAECERSENHWSEFDHEWNNWFVRRFRPQMMSTGGGIDGPEVDLSHYMRAPAPRNSGLLTCSVVSADGSITGTLSASACRRWFTRGWVDLMIHIDEQTATFEATVWPSFADSPDGRHIVMRRTIENEPGHPQPMYVVFSQLLGPGRSLRQRQGFSIDWFYFTPEYGRVTNLKVVQDDVRALRSRGLVRVNTTGAPLEAPGTAEQDRWHAIDVKTLQGPIIRDSRYFWTAYPAMNNGAYYHLDWSYRTRTRARDNWSAWSGFHRSGFVFSLPQSSSTPPEAVEIRTRIQYVDIFGQPTASRVRCFGYRSELQRAYDCD